MDASEEPSQLLAVKEAIENFVPREGFKVVEKRESEFSFIFRWGVRVQLIADDAGVPPNQGDGEVDLARDDQPDEEPTGSDRENQDRGNGSNASAAALCRSSVGWICLAGNACRKSQRIIALPRGFTSKATLHLSKQHGINSAKTKAEQTNKRKYQDEFETLQKSQLHRDDPARLVILLETRRIVLNCLPFEIARYSDTMLLNQLTARPEFQKKISVNDIRHTIVEMYATTKREVVHYIKENKVQPSNAMSLVVDFWTSPFKKTKFLGVRVYLIDKSWRYQSVLLGTREFCPTYGECEAGRSGPFERWIVETLLDFGLSVKDFFGSTTDGGADVKKMMQTTLKLKWQWCIPHLSNAATKAACGMHKSKKKKDAMNPGMVEIVRLMARTIYIVMSNEKMGSLWNDLCQMLGREYRAPREHPAFPDEESKGDDSVSDTEQDESDTDDPLFAESMAPKKHASHRVNKATKLLNFQSHRFMGLVRVIRRILERWGALKEWFGEVEAKAARAQQASPYSFPLKKHNKVLVQLLSLLSPIGKLNAIAQAESANQVDVLLELYVLRLEVLDVTMPLPHYLSTDEKPRTIDVVDIKPVVLRTRQLLFEAFEKRFFCRYLRSYREQMKNEPFIMETQLFLDPRYKDWTRSLEKVVRVCNAQAGESAANVEEHVSRISRAVRGRVRTMMANMAQAATAAQPPRVAVPNQGAAESQQSRHASLFGRRSSNPIAPIRSEVDRAEDEISKWIDEDDTMMLLPTGRIETILEFWCRKSKEPGYEYLPKVVRIVYSAPTSSAQIERDFGMSGMMVTKNRSRLSAANIDMCSFLKANKQFLDITQVGSLKKKEAELQKPRVSLVEMTSMIDANVNILLNDGFSSLNMSAEELGDDFYQHGMDF